jgi:hypothetical protein
MFFFVPFILIGVLIMLLSFLTQTVNYKEDLINEPLFFRSFAVGLMVFGFSGALFYAFHVNPVFTVMLAALFGLIIFFATFLLVSIFCVNKD